MTLTILSIEGKVIRYAVYIPIEGGGTIKIVSSARIGEPIELNYN